MCQRTKQMTFWEIGVGLWSTAYFVYNSGRFRGGAWAARAPILFLDFWRRGPPYLRVWMTGCPPPPLSEGLDLPLYNNIATTHLSL